MAHGLKHLKTEEGEESTNLQFSADEHEPLGPTSTTTAVTPSATPATLPDRSSFTPPSRKKDDDPNRKRRKVVSSACLACRKRKSKCDGKQPACAACASVYLTDCIYDPSSDHRRKGVYKKDIDNLKTRNSTLQTLIQAILNYPEDKVLQLVYDIRNCESLDDVAAKIMTQAADESDDESDLEDRKQWDDTLSDSPPCLESDIAEKIGALSMDSQGQVKFIGATTSLSLLPMGMASSAMTGDLAALPADPVLRDQDPMTSWTEVTKDRSLIVHLMNMYFTWHYPYFTTLSKRLFFIDFLRGNPGRNSQQSKTSHCTPLLVNAMLALGCHFTVVPGSRRNPSKPETAGDHFFQEAKRLIMENDEHEHPRLATTQALALMSVREAGCGREARGWVYSGMSFRMACDLGLQWNPDGLSGMSDEEIDARKVTFWGCFLFDKCWSNYTGRLPQLPSSSATTPKYDVFPDEDSELWTPYTDNGLASELSQPGRTRAVALQLIGLCEISNDILLGFYQPVRGGATKESKLGKGKSGKDIEMKKMLELYNRLEKWNEKLPAEMAAREGALMSVLVMHMFGQLLYLLLFRPFLSANNSGSASFPANISPKRICINASTAISKILRMYRQTYGLKQIPNIVVYMVLSACTIHLMNMPAKTAKRDIVQGIKCLEGIAEYWLCAKRALIILKVLSLKYSIELTDEAEIVLSRIDTSGEMFGFSRKDLFGPSPSQKLDSSQNRRSPARVPVLGAPPLMQGHAMSLAAGAPATSTAAMMGLPANTKGPTSATNVEFGSPFLNSGASLIVSPSNSMLQPAAPIAPQVSASSLFTPYFDPGVNSSSNSYGRRSQEPPASGTPNTATAAISMPQNSSSSNGSSPNMFAATFGPMEEQPQDWWLRDQNELAQDFGSWDFSSASGGTISPEPTFEERYSPPPPPPMPSNLQTYVQQVQTTAPQQPSTFGTASGFDGMMYWQS
ncbi:hypothetical protein DRE_01909 [Drechslerella stenobrocha 248]|uniref:Zn(2)-C6 fungal-type domain-containing protein n=1 Tax=Drechslerella stenobrocha 248 TaxID=1043628 RepID=W7I9C5_9PEZI|nr:hypothetical protein DRE_01909 [Drechslerella stenobrocha 248]